MGNRFFLGPTPNGASSIININKVIFGSIFEQRENKSKSKIILMLPDGDLGTHPSLNAFQEKTYEEILEEIKKPEWQYELI